MPLKTKGGVDIFFFEISQKIDEKAMCYSLFLHTKSEIFALKKCSALCNNDCF